MKTVKLIMVLLLLAMTLATQSNAQETISAEKRALIKEFLVVTDSKNNAEKVLDSMLLQIEKEMPKILMQTSSQDPRVKQMNSQQQAALKKYIDESSVRIGKRFRELVQQRLNFAETIEQISYPLYDKFFTEGELRDLIVFYGSATGKKAVSVMPQLVTESMQRYSEVAMPKLLQLITEISEEEMKHLIK